MFARVKGRESASSDELEINQIICGVGVVGPAIPGHAAEASKGIFPD